MKTKDMIVQVLKTHKRISNKELSQICKVSIPTVRKFVNELVKENKIDLVYGGIKSKELDILNSNKDFQVIAQEAVKLVHNGDSIFLGPGKTVAAMCSYLKKITDLTVFTNSFYVIEMLADMPNITMVVIGGLYQPINKCFSLMSDEHIPNVNVSKIFVSGAGINPQRGIYHRLPSNRHTEESFARQAQQVILLADSSKFGKDKPFVLMPIDIVNVTISTKDLKKEYINELKQHNIDVILG